ncbi:MAG: class I SAM-dependent methyltransferase [Alphaproteobacteria bacterium]
MTSPDGTIAATPIRFDDGEAYERFMGRWSRAAGAVFLDWLGPPSFAHWLDVGCGTGVFTELVVEHCAPATVCAIDPAGPLIATALRRPIAGRASFRMADAGAMPFADAFFDIVASALVFNFLPDRPRALGEMRRVARPGGLVAGYVWDFATERSPSGPLRLGLRRIGREALPIPGTAATGTDALAAAFRAAGLERIATRVIDVTEGYADFDDFWNAQTPGFSPATHVVAALSPADRSRLRDAVRGALPAAADGGIRYPARAHAIMGYVPG